MQTRPAAPRQLAILFLLNMSLLSFLWADPLPVGSAAPTPAAIDQDGKPVDLAALYQKGITLVYFYPKADTPGCTAQACSLRDSIVDLKALGIQVVGVSRDTPESQKKFQEKYALPFTLIADKDGAVAKVFGVPSMVISARQSFLVKDGKIVWMTPKADTAGHAQQVETAIKAL